MRRSCPPAPAFAKIARDKEVSIETLRQFLPTTHRDISATRGMSNPRLMDFQIDEVAAYILSLRITP